MSNPRLLNIEASKRDLRVDVLRGISLLMIFIDHIPDNSLGLVTIHNFGFSDAAEVFVLLAGFSSMLAYGTPGWRRPRLASNVEMKQCWQAPTTRAGGNLG